MDKNLAKPIREWLNSSQKKIMDDGVYLLRRLNINNVPYESLITD